MRGVSSWVSLWAGACALLAACWSPSPPAAPAPVAAPKRSLIEEARALERGAGVPRDYRRAAAIYERLCDGGGGSLEACRALEGALRDGRGLAVDRERLAVLDAALCERGDAAACVVSSFHGAISEGTEAAADKLGAALERARQACEKQDGRACQIAAELRGGDGSTAESDRMAKYGAACRAGLFEGCEKLAYEVGMCGEPEVDDPAACEARLLAEWRKESFNADRVDAYERMQRGCAAGDASACEGIPSRQLPRKALCAAHDYGACAELGCVGDDAAEKLAIDHGVTAPNCYVAGKRALFEWRREKVGLPPIVSDRKPPVGARPMAPLEAVRFTHRGGRDAKGWPRYDAHNLGDQPITELVVCAYAYGEGDAQLARVEVALAEVPIAPNGIAAVELARGTGAVPALPAATLGVEISYSRARQGSAAPAVDATRCAAQRPAGSPDLYGW